MELKYGKDSNPIELYDYAVAKKIDDEPAFAWWVHYFFKKRDMIISKAKTKYWRTTHKYGVSLPETTTEALGLDRHTGHPLWKII